VAKQRGQGKNHRKQYCVMRISVITFHLRCFWWNNLIWQKYRSGQISDGRYRPHTVKTAFQDGKNR